LLEGEKVNLINSHTQLCSVCRI